MSFDGAGYGADDGGGHEHTASVHEQWDELAVGFAMSALEPDELERFVDHLVITCPDCRQSVTDMAELGAVLGTAMQAPAPEPRIDLRDSVLSAAFAARPAVPQDAAVLDRAIWPAATTTPRRVESLEPVERKQTREPVDELAVRRSRKLSERAGWLTAAAAAVIALVLSVTTVGAVRSRDQKSALASDYDTAISAFARGGSATTVPLSDNSGHTIATVVARAHNVSIVTRGVKSNSASTSYVLWGMAKRNGTPVALGDFDVSNGTVQTVQVAADARGAYSSLQMFGLSIEPGHTPPPKPSTILALGER